MRAGLYWLDDAWPGQLALAARPRGGDWLTDDIANWKRAGISSVLSLLTPEEENDLDLRDEGREAKRQGVDFVSFPIPDLQAPRSEARLAEVLAKVDNMLSAGKSVVVHCRQGIGRSGLVAACVLVRRGMSPCAAVEKCRQRVGYRCRKHRSNEIGSTTTPQPARNERRPR